MNIYDIQLDELAEEAKQALACGDEEWMNNVAMRIHLTSILAGHPFDGEPRQR